MTHPTAPELDVHGWLNGPGPTLRSLRGRVVLLEAFQLLCPACVSHGIPQARRVDAAFPTDELAVIGIHTVFEHHAAMGPETLAAFVAEYGISFPVAIDRHRDDDPIPVTMAAYGFRGTPSTVLIDRAGAIRFHAFGAVDDLVLGAEIGRLLSEAPDPAGHAATAARSPVACTPGEPCA